MPLCTEYTLWRNARIATMNPDVTADYGLLNHYDLLVRAGKIESITPSAQTPPHLYNQPSPAATVIDLNSALITPGFIDCHTHLVFGGNRAAEWEMRLNGVPYVDIAQRGGGINATVTATRHSSEDQLYAKSAQRLRALLAEGVTTVEIKSGYGLDLENERKQLRVVQRLAQSFPIDISPTLLSAHTVPKEYLGKADDYIEEICQHILPTLWQEGLFEAVDVFCENVGFSLAQTQKVFQAAAQLGIPVKGHTEQLSHLGGSALVAQHHGWSVDHIEYLNETDVMVLKKSNTVATLLPLAYYFLKETKQPPVQLLREHGIPIAVSTDFNPGTAPFASIRLALNMACVQFGLTPKEALAGVTRNAAQALGRAQTHGQIKTGFVADFLVWDVEHPVEIFYELGLNPLQYRVFRGTISPVVQ